MKYLIEDTSFIVSLLDKKDVFHQEAYNIFLSILRTNNLKVIIPSVVLQETLFTLLKNGVDASTVTNKLKRLSKIKQVDIYSVEENLFNLIKHYQAILTLKESFKTTDSTVISCAMEFNHSYVLTSDKRMKNYHLPVYTNICLFQDQKDCADLNDFLQS